MSIIDQDPLTHLKTEASHAYRRLQDAVFDGVQKLQQSLSDVQEAHRAIVYQLETHVIRLELASIELKSHQKLKAQCVELQDEVLELKDKIYRVRLRNLLEYEKSVTKEFDHGPQLGWLKRQVSGADCLLDADMMLHWGGLQGESCGHVRDSFEKIYCVTPQQIRDLGVADFFMDNYGDPSEQLFKIIDHRANKGLNNQTLKKHQRDTFDKVLRRINSGVKPPLFSDLCKAYWRTGSTRQAGRSSTGKKSSERSLA